MSFSNSIKSQNRVSFHELVKSFNNKRYNEFEDSFNPRLGILTCRLFHPDAFS